MTSLVDFNVSTPRNKTQSSNECGVVINNTITNESRAKSPKRQPTHLGDLRANAVRYPLDSEAPSVQAEIIEEPYIEREVTVESPEITELRLLNELHKEIALALSIILKSNNHKLLANLIDQSGKIIIDVRSLCIIISKQLNIPLDWVHIEYIQKEAGCIAKISRIHDVQNIKINHIDYKLGYNEKYNILGDQFSISLSKVIA
jgi:hypothetical protein